MDVLGYVLIVPQLSVAGLRNLVTVHEMNRMLTASVMPATSRLVINRPFVLRHLERGHGAEVLEKTLLADEVRRPLRRNQTNQPTNQPQRSRLWNLPTHAIDLKRNQKRRSRGGGHT